MAGAIKSPTDQYTAGIYVLAPLSASILWDGASNTAYVFHDGEYKPADLVTKKASAAVSIATTFPSFPPAFQSSITAAVMGGDGFAYFMNGPNLIKVNPSDKSVVWGPDDITKYISGWVSSWSHAIDAAIGLNEATMLFFQQNECAEVTLAGGTWSLQTPQKTNATFSNWPSDPQWQSLSAVAGPVTISGAAKAFFFSGNYFIQVDLESKAVDTTPAPISEWSGLLWPASFDVFAGVADHLTTTSGTPYTPIPAGNWSHVAVVCTDNNALAFDGERMVTIPSGTDLNPQDAFSIDAAIRWNGPIAGVGTQYILAKSDVAGSDASYSLGIDSAGKLVFTYYYSDGGGVNRTVAPSNLTLTAGQPYYVAAYAEIYSEVTQGTTRDTVTYYLRVGGTVYDLSTNALVSDNPDATVVDSKYKFAPSQQAVAIGALSTASPAGTTAAQRGYFSGEIGMIRYWARSIIADAPALARTIGVPGGMDGPAANWPCDAGVGRELEDTAGTHEGVLDTVEMWIHSRVTSRLTTYVNGQAVVTRATNPAALVTPYPSTDGITLGGLEISGTSVTGTLASGRAL